MLALPIAGRWRLVLSALAAAFALTAAPWAARAQVALTGFDHYPEFRGLSGLAGGSFGADAYGRPSLAAPTAYSTPTAHVLGHNRFRLSIDSISSRSGVRIGGAGYQGLTGMFGTTLAHVNVAVSDIVLSGQGDQAFNLQAQYVPRLAVADDAAVGPPLAFSIGVQDVGGGGGSAGIELPGDSRSSRSVFGVATYRLGAQERSPYVSAGLGTRRFANGFASASYQVLGPVRAWIEHDGFAINFGALTTWQTKVSGRPFEANLQIGVVDGRYMTMGAGIGF